MCGTVFPRQHITGFITSCQFLHQLRARANPHRYKHTGNRQDPGLICLPIPDADSLYLLCSLNFLHYVTEQNFHVRKSLQLLLKYCGSPKLVSAVDEIYLFTGSGQICRILQRHIASSHHCRRLPPEKGAVAGSTVGYAPSCQFFLTGHSQMRMNCPGSQNYRHGFQASVIGVYQLIIAFIFYRKDLRLPEFHTQPVRMLAKLHSHVETIDARHSQIVIHLIGIQHLSAAHGIFFYNQQIKACPLAVNCSRKSCRSRTDYDEIIHYYSPIFCCQSNYYPLISIIVYQFYSRNTRKKCGTINRKRSPPHS